MKRCAINIRSTRVYVVRGDDDAVLVRLPGDFLDITEKLTAAELARARAALEKHETSPKRPQPPAGNFGGTD